jgi:hypothetical protein
MTSNQPTPDREPGELPNQPPEISSMPGSGPAFGTASGRRDSAPSMNNQRWGQDPFDSTRDASGMNGGGMKMPMPKAAIGAVAAGLTALAFGVMMRRRKKHSKTQDVTDQAKRLLSDISDKMPTVEEGRAKVLAVDDLRNRKELKGKRFAALARK